MAGVGSCWDVRCAAPPGAVAAERAPGGMKRPRREYARLPPAIGFPCREDARLPSALVFRVGSVLASLPRLVCARGRSTCPLRYVRRWSLLGLDADTVASTVKTVNKTLASRLIAPDFYAPVDAFQTARIRGAPYLLRTVFAGAR
eukprot:5095217-Pyramimonas_sp.AAC.2